MPAARETRQTHKVGVLQAGSSIIKPASKAKVNQPVTQPVTKPVVLASEVIEISDSDDDVPAPSRKRKTSLVSTLERDVKKLKQVNIRPLSLSLMLIQSSIVVFTGKSSAQD